ILIIGTTVVYSQMQHVRNINLGFNQEQVVAIRIPSIGWVEQKRNLAAIKQELLTIPQVAQTSNAQQLPGDGALPGEYLVQVENKQVKKTINTIGVDYGYLDLMEIKLAAGRNFSKDIRTDEDFKVIINEAAAKELGWTDAIDK